MLSAETTKPAATEPQPPTLEKNGRFYTVVAALILALLAPLLALLVPLLGLSTGLKAAVAGLLLAGVPEVLMLVAAALLGKQTLHYLIHRARRTVREAVIVGPVSKTRYYAGLAISLASIVPLYLYGYLPDAMPAGNARFYLLAAADMSFILSMFMMGGEFWEKLRRLFVWEGTT